MLYVVDSELKLRQCHFQYIPYTLPHVIGMELHVHTHPCFILGSLRKTQNTGRGLLSLTNLIKDYLDNQSVKTQKPFSLFPVLLCTQSRRLVDM